MWKNGRSVVIVLSWLLVRIPQILGEDGPYCGLYAVYGAAAALGATADFEELLDTQFVSDRRGSSVEDLTKAARHLGLDARPFSRLGFASICEATVPLVLHISSLGQLDYYNHWLLFRVLPASLPEGIFRHGYRGSFPFWGGRPWLGGSVVTIRGLWHVGGSGLRRGGVRGRWGLGFRISSGRWL